MTDDSQHTRQPGAPGQEGGDKNTNDLSDVNDVQRPDMLEKGRQVDQTPKDVTGEHDGIQPINQRR